MSTEILTPQFNPDSDETPSEIAVLRNAALTQQNTVLAAREVIRCREAYMGRLYEGETVLPWKPACVHPKVHEVVERFSSTLSDSRVKFEPHARNDEDEILAQVMLAGSDFEWERQRMDLKMQVLSRGLLMDGTEHLYTGLDADGECSTRILSPFTWISDPSATDETDMAYGFARFSMTRSEIEKKWPKFAGAIFEKVHKGTSPLRIENTFNSVAATWPRNSQFGTLQINATTSVDMEFSTPQAQRSAAGNRYRVEEWWFQKGEDRELMLDLADETQVAVMLPSMSRGRRIYVIEGHTFGELGEDFDGPNPYDHGMIPVSRVVSINLLGEYLGLPYIQPGLDTAEQLADIDNQIMANVRLMMHPVWTIPFECRVDFTKFFSAPGMVMPYRGTSGLKPEAHTMPALPSYVFQLREIKRQEFDDAMGINDISRGNYSGGLEDVSGKAVQLLQRPAYTRMKPIQMSIEYAVTRWGQQTMCNMMQYWQEERWRRVLPFEIQDMPLPWIEDKKQAMMAEAMGMPAMPPPTVDKYLPEIRMQAGSNLPENQEARNGLAFNLYDRMAFGPPGSMPANLELLKGVKYPDAENIAAQGAMANQQQQMMQAQMAAEQAGPDGKKAPPKTGDKAMGGEASPADQQAVMENPSGQEVGA